MQRLLAEEGEELPALAWGMLRRAVKPFVRTLLHGCGRVPRMNLFHDAMKTVSWHIDRKYAVCFTLCH